MGVRNWLRGLIRDSDTPCSQRFDLFIQTLIVVSLISFAAETYPELPARLRSLLNKLGVATVVIFSFEYALRLWAAPKKLQYIFSFFGIIDLVAILPFYLSLGIDLRSIRVFRMLRLFRGLKILRFGRAVQRFRTAFLMIRAELTLFLAATLFLLYVSAVGIYYFEHAAQPETFKSVFHAFWWAITTLTTVGYGDVVPVTVGGRVFTFVMLMVGLGVVAVPTGLISSALTNAIDQERKKRT